MKNFYLNFFYRGYFSLCIVVTPLISYFCFRNTDIGLRETLASLDVFYPRLDCDLKVFSGYIVYNGDVYVGSILLGIAFCGIMILLGALNLVLFPYREIRARFGRRNQGAALTVTVIALCVPLAIFVFLMHSYWPTINGQEGGCSWLEDDASFAEFSKQFWWSLFLSGWLLCTIFHLVNLIMVHSFGLVFKRGKARCTAAPALIAETEQTGNGTLGKPFPLCEY